MRNSGGSFQAGIGSGRLKNLDGLRTINRTGGFVFTQVHNVQAKVPAENVEAMLDAAFEFGVY
jgi:hypothetical protein